MTMSVSRPPSFFPILPLSTSVRLRLRLRLRRLPSVSVSASQSFSPEYLIHSCGLPSDEAVRAYDKIRHLKSPEKPDAVLRFLRDIGISDSDIRRAVSRDARVLCSSVERNLRPNVAKLQEVGFSIHDISSIISRNPNLFKFNFAPKIDFWFGVLGSVENLSVAIRRPHNFLTMNLEKAILPNLYFLKDHCGFSPSQIVRLIRSAPGVVGCSTESLKKKAQRADKLGIARSSGMFLYALITISKLSQHTIDRRLNNLKSLGLSQEEVNLIVSKDPLLLGLKEKLVSSKMEFLLKDAGCDKLDVVQNPTLLNLSLENRLIPRNVVRKLLMSKGSPPANYKLISLVTPTEKKFVEKYVLPYEHVIPGLHRAYADACARKKKCGNRLVSRV
ncbi:Mitochondrial transcription termination factor-like [Rhynchospora pubera]|uniref:Mitochondrial transcription termination factor-like n=1 Tax=Rhynchospora pubera TaxID=906938 RepID=A0AAV8BM27_9POAL|nr:Mitochondrial transcription termination factor-like [Rhynchospora pubera]